MRVLFVNSCPRGYKSRTLRLAVTFLNSLEDAEIIEHDLNTMGLQSIDKATLAKREQLCCDHAWNDPFLAPAVEFQQADLVVIAAPYWDLSFPSILKTWVEHMWVRNLTFHYDETGCVGHCQAKRCVYITTSGSPIGDNDWGMGYIRAVMQALGIPSFDVIKAEGIDIDGCDVMAVLAKAEREARSLARSIHEEEK